MVMDTWLVTTKRTGSGIGMDGRVVNDFYLGIRRSDSHQVSLQMECRSQVFDGTGRYRMDRSDWSFFFTPSFLLSGSNTDLVALYCYYRLALG
jgi:hypothetical protein